MLFFCAATIAGLFLPLYYVEYYAVLAAVESAISGFLAIRNERHEVRVTDLDGKAVRNFREFIASDSKVAIAFLQLAIIAQSLAVFHPGLSEGTQEVNCHISPQNPRVLICPDLHATKR